LLVVPPGSGASGVAVGVAPLLLNTRPVVGVLVLPLPAKLNPTAMPPLLTPRNSALRPERTLSSRVLALAL
jgi:hypothetical protein